MTKKIYILVNEFQKVHIVLLEEDVSTFIMQFRGGDKHYHHMKDERNIEEVKDECLNLGYKTMKEF